MAGADSSDPMEAAGSLGDADDSDDLRVSADDGHGESTECSSSFGPSCSASDGEAGLGVHDMEVDSPFFGHVNADGAASVPKSVRQKQVTAEWRKAVRPLMWRFQWLELRMKNLLSQVATYDKELALIKHEKDLQLEMIKADGSNPERSAKLDVQSHDRNTMKRRKRQRREEIMDTSLYMNNHQIFSYYYESKNSGAETDNLLIDDNFDNAEKKEETLQYLPNIAQAELTTLPINAAKIVDDTQRRVPGNTLPESKETDRVFEQYCLRDILLTIDGIQSRVLGLQDRLNKACSNQEQVKVPQKSHKARIPPASCNKDGHRPQKKRDLHTLLQKDDKCRPLVGVPSTLSDRSIDYVTGYAKRNIAEEGATQPYAKKVTFEAIFGADNPLISTHVGELYREDADDILIDNKAAQVEGYQQFEKIKQEAKNHVELANKVANTLLFRGEETIARQVAKYEPVHELARTMKQVCPGNNRGKKPKKKLMSSLPSSKDQTEKSPDVPAKNGTEKEVRSVKNENPVFIAVDTRRSKRVRKPKKYGSD